MTTIAYRDGVLAADSATTVGHIRAGSLTKIVAGPLGEMAGAAGDAGFNTKFTAWVASGRRGDPPEPKLDKDGCTDYGFIVLPGGSIEIHESAGVHVMTAPFFAAGSGRELALGAMGHGASAEEAVKVAISLDCYSGGEITVLKAPNA